MYKLSFIIVIFFYSIFYHPRLLFIPMSIKCLSTHFVIIIIIQESMCDLSFCIDKFILSLYSMMV